MTEPEATALPAASVIPLAVRVYVLVVLLGVDNASTYEVSDSFVMPETVSAGVIVKLLAVGVAASASEKTTRTFDLPFDFALRIVGAVVSSMIDALYTPDAVPSALKNCA